MCIMRIKKLDSAHSVYYNINIEQQKGALLRCGSENSKRFYWRMDGTSSSEGFAPSIQTPTKPGKVTIPEHGGDIHMDTVKSIKRQAGI